MAPTSNATTPAGHAPVCLTVLRDEFLERFRSKSGTDYYMARGLFRIAGELGAVTTEQGVCKNKTQ